MAAVAETLSMNRTTLTAALKPLVRRGIVQAGQAPDNRRARTLKLTAGGRELLANAASIWDEANKALDCALAELELAHFNGHLNRL